MQVKSQINAYIRLARLDKPTGIWLLLIPCWFGLALAESEKYWLYAVFAVGAIIMRSAGCIINDIADRNLDKHVERTKNRPLASGEVTIIEALIILSALLLIGFLLLITLPKISIYIGLAAMPLVLLYPLMKRVTSYPQAVLGVVFNSGVLIAYAAATGTIILAAALLYIGCIFWTLGYDTIYAMQDAPDDKAAGIKSTALKFGARTQKMVAIFYAIFAVCIFANLSFSVASIVLWALAAAQLGWQIYKISGTAGYIYGNLFKSNTYVGLMLLAALLF